MSIMANESIILLEDLEFSIPCDAATAEDWPDTPGPAKWAALHRCPGCDYNHLFLLCNDCKEFIFQYEDYNQCQYCNHVERRLSLFFASFEPI